MNSIDGMLILGVLFGADKVVIPKIKGIRGNRMAYTIWSIVFLVIIAWFSDKIQFSK
ncbi:hypothetical protein [Spongiimicrobium salis]|uniref:hypothetical protein n=1 Tax=Spongiimicrobium salis TaxID=1667022 RepID=UPI00374D4E5E